MKRSKFSEVQIVNLLKEHEAGVPVTDLCRKAGVSSATFYKWKAKYGGMEASDVQRLRELEAENARLKRMYADLSLVHDALKYALEKNGYSLLNEKSSPKR